MNLNLKIWQFQTTFSNTKWFQLKKASRSRLYNSSIYITFSLVIFPLWLCFNNLNLNFKLWQLQTTFLNTKWFQMKKSSTTKLYNSSKSITFILVIFLYNIFWTVWIWIWKYNNFKQHFQILNDINWKSHQQQSWITHQDLKLLFWSFLHTTKW